MAQLFYNANVFLDGYSLRGSLNIVTVDYSAASLDATTFGNASKTMQGGLKTYNMTGKGFFQAGAGTILEGLISVGNDAAAVMVFPDAIVEGSTSTGAGYMFPVTEAKVSFGGKVGDLESIDFTAAGRDA